MSPAEAARHALLRRWRHHWHSIGGRLSFLFGLASLAIAALVAVSLDVALRGSIYQDEIDSLTDQIDAIGMVLRRDSDLVGPEGMVVRRQYSVVQNVDYVIRVLRADGGLVFETPGMAGLLPARAFPIARAATSQAPRHRVRRREGRTFVTVTAAITPAGAGVLCPGDQLLGALATDAFAKMRRSISPISS